MFYMFSGSDFHLWRTAFFIPRADDVRAEARLDGPSRVGGPVLTRLAARRHWLAPLYNVFEAFAWVRPLSFSFLHTQLIDRGVDLGPGREGEEKLNGPLPIIYGFPGARSGQDHSRRCQGPIATRRFRGGGAFDHGFEKTTGRNAPARGAHYFSPAAGAERGKGASCNYFPPLFPNGQRGSRGRLPDVLAKKLGFWARQTRPGFHRGGGPILWSLVGHGPNFHGNSGAAF